jgi:hypothetical protein
MYIGFSKSNSDWLVKKYKIQNKYSIYGTVTYITAVAYITAFYGTVTYITAVLLHIVAIHIQALVVP